MSDIQLLEANLKRLRLSGMAKVLSIRLHEAEVGELPYQQFLCNLVNDQLNKQASNVYTKRLKEAHFPALKTIDQFDFNFNATIKKREVMDLLTCRCLVEKRNVLFIGPPGVGKTHLSIALGISAIEKGNLVSFRSIYDFLEELALAQAAGFRTTFMKKMIQVPLLIIDEFGMKNMRAAFAEDLMEILHRRYGVHSTVICTNRPIEDWATILGDVPSATAILDRFLEGIYLFKITGKSYRLQGGKIVSLQEEQRRLEHENKRDE
jgi:DNA replication protein DnaC